MGKTEPILTSRSNAHRTTIVLKKTTTVVPGRLELPTSTLSVWRSNHLSYRTGRRTPPNSVSSAPTPLRMERYTKPYTSMQKQKEHSVIRIHQIPYIKTLQKGGVPAAPSGTATLLRLHPNHRLYLRRLAPEGYPTGFGHFRLSWCDGRCVQGPGTYSPQYADLRLLAIPTSRRRVAAYDPN